jgi:XTP/dITP diphosphohydrolase
MSLLFATNNQNKVDEIRSQLSGSITIITLKEAEIFEEIPEPWHTIEANSTHKAEYIFAKYKLDCFSEDTGLIVPALNGEPGVKSARYAGEKATSLENIKKLLTNLNGMENRNAYFKTVITYCKDGKFHQFEGICEGRITEYSIGENGFGYDPIFIPNGSEICFAEMNKEQKNIFSHRRKAIDQLIAFLNEHE